MKRLKGRLVLKLQLGDGVVLEVGLRAEHDQGRVFGRVFAVGVIGRPFLALDVVSGMGGGEEFPSDGLEERDVDVFVVVVGCEVGGGDVLDTNMRSVFGIVSCDKIGGLTQYL